jgi:hypothetical protein
MRGHILDPIPSLTNERPDLPRHLDAVLARMLAKEPKARFATVGDAVAALKAAVTDPTPSDEITEIIRTPVSGSMRKGRASGVASLVMRSRWRIVGTAAFVTIVGWIGTIAIRDGVVPAPVAANATDSGRVESPEQSSPATPSGPGTRREEELTPVEGTRTATAPATTPAPPVATPATGTVRIGSRIPLAVLFLNDGQPRLIGEQGLQAITRAAGELRLSIRRDGCTPWDTTITVAAGSTHTIGYRAPRC